MRTSVAAIRTTSGQKVEDSEKARSYGRHRWVIFGHNCITDFITQTQPDHTPTHKHARANTNTHYEWRIGTCASASQGRTTYAAAGRTGACYWACRASQWIPMQCDLNLLMQCLAKRYINTIQKLNKRRWNIFPGISPPILSGCHHVISLDHVAKVLIINMMHRYDA